MDIKALGRSVLISSLLLAIVLTELIVYGGFGISVVISVMVYLALVFYLGKKTGKKQNANAKWILGAMILDTLCFVLFNDLLLQFFNIILLLMLVATHALIVFKEEKYEYFTSKWYKYIVFNWFRLPFVHLNAPFKIIREEANDKQNEKLKAVGSIIAKIVITSIISIPILMLVGGLLADADAAFEGVLTMLEQSLNNIQIGDIGGRIITISILFFISSSCFYTILIEDKKKEIDIQKGLKKNEESKSLTNEISHTGEEQVLIQDTIKEETKNEVEVSGAEEKEWIDFTVVATVVTLIAGIYVLYCLSQFSYFISAFQGILPENFTRAEYARRGFFETLPIIAINLIIIYVLNVWTQTKDHLTKKLYIKGMTLFIIGFSGFIATSALAKMFMYMGYYGLTIRRIYVAWFLILTLIVLAVVLLRILFGQINVIKTISITFTVMYLGLNYASVDYIVGNYNINLYEEGKLTDLDACYDLNNTILISLEKLIKENPQMKEDSCIKALVETFTIYRANDNNWQQWNVADMLADEARLEISEQMVGLYQ